MIPGSDLLTLAMSVLGSSSVDYYAFSSRTPNIAGIDVTNYLPAVTYDQGSVQAIARQNYQRLGLDYNKRYIIWYIPDVDAVDLARDVSGDVIETLGRRWELVGAQDWLQIDGWRSLMAVDIGPATGGELTNA